MRTGTEVLCISVLRVASVPRVKLASCKSASTPPHPPLPPPSPVVYSTDGGPDVIPTLCSFVVYSTRRFVLCFTLCYFGLVDFGLFKTSFKFLIDQNSLT